MPDERRNLNPIVGQAVCPVMDQPDYKNVSQETSETLDDQYWTKISLQFKQDE